MKRFHVKPDGQVMICKADPFGPGCPFIKKGAEHFNSFEEAVAYSEKLLENKFGVLSSATHSTVVPTKKNHMDKDETYLLVHLETGTVFGDDVFIVDNLTEDDFEDPSGIDESKSRNIKDVYDISRMNNPMVFHPGTGTLVDCESLHAIPINLIDTEDDFVEICDDSFYAEERVKDSGFKVFS